MSEKACLKWPLDGTTSSPERRDDAFDDQSGSSAQQLAVDPDDPPTALFQLREPIDVSGALNRVEPMLSPPVELHRDAPLRPAHIEARYQMAEFIDDLDLRCGNRQPGADEEQSRAALLGRLCARVHQIERLAQLHDPSRTPPVAVHDRANVSVAQVGRVAQCVEQDGSLRKVSSSAEIEGSARRRRYRNTADVTDFVGVELVPMDEDPPSPACRCGASIPRDDDHRSNDTRAGRRRQARNRRGLIGPHPSGFGLHRGCQFLVAWNVDVAIDSTEVAVETSTTDETRSDRR